MYWRLFQTVAVVLVSAGLASADMARHEYIETPGPPAEMDAFGCSCPRLSSRCEPMKLGRDQGLVSVLTVSRPSKVRAPRAEEEKKIAELGADARTQNGADADIDRPHGPLVTSVDDKETEKAAGFVVAHGVQEAARQVTPESAP